MNALRRFTSILCLVVAFSYVSAAAESLRFVGWNAEANFNGADPTVIAERMAFMPDVDVWGFCEVKDSNWADELEYGAHLGSGDPFDHVLGTTGGQIKLLVIFNTDRFDRVGDEELHDINQGNHRAPLVVKLRLKSTAQEILVMVNHLARGNASLRREQATKLNQWAGQQSLPIIALGDYNFDWHYRHGESDHDEGYDNMVAGNVFRWVRPPVLIRTQASHFDGVLDFVFTANLPAAWQATAIIVREPGDFPDNDSTPDHRPVIATLTTD